MTEKSNLWGQPQSDGDLTTLENSSPTPNNKPTWSTNRRIRWGLVDPIVAVALTIATQLAISVALIIVYASQNAQQLEELSAADLEEGLLDFAFSGPFLLISNLLMYASWWFAIRHARKKGFNSYAKDFWLKYRLPRDILIGLGFAALFRGLEFGVMAGLSAIGVDMEGADNSSIIVDMEGIWYFLTAIVMAGILGPFMEEFLFRGLGLQVLLRTFQHPRLRWNARNNGNAIGAFIFRSRTWLAIAVTSTIFGFMHFQGAETFGQWFVVIWTGTLGVVLAVITVKTKRLGPAIFGHIFFNLSGVILATLL